MFFVIISGVFISMQDNTEEKGENCKVGKQGLLFQIWQTMVHLHSVSMLIPSCVNWSKYSRFELVKRDPKAYTYQTTYSLFGVS